MVREEPVLTRTSVKYIASLTTVFWGVNLLRTHSKLSILNPKRSPLPQAQRSERGLESLFFFPLLVHHRIYQTPLSHRRWPCVRSTDDCLSSLKRGLQPLVNIDRLSGLIIWCLRIKHRLSPPFKCLHTTIDRAFGTVVTEKVRTINPEMSG